MPPPSRREAAGDSNSSQRERPSPLRCKVLFYRRAGACSRRKPPSEREVARVSVTEGAHALHKLTIKKLESVSRLLPQSPFGDSSLPEGAFLFVRLALYGSSFRAVQKRSRRSSAPWGKVLLGFAQAHSEKLLEKFLQDLFKTFDLWVLHDFIFVGLTNNSTKPKASPRGSEAAFRW